MRDQAVRLSMGISLRAAARLAGVSHNTLRLYEASTDAVKRERARKACAWFYARCRSFLAQPEPA